MVYTPISVAKRCSSDSVVLPGHIPLTNLASARPCLIPSRILPLGNSGTVSRNNLRTLSSCCLSRDTFHATIHTSMAGGHFDRETCLQLEPQASNMTFHCVLCSPNCTNALPAESWCCLNLELNSTCTCPRRNVCPPTTSKRVVDQPSELHSHTLFA